MTSDTLLWRQAHPNFMDGKRPTSQVFFPFPKDNGKLSVYDGDQVNAEDSYKHYTEVLKNESASVWAVIKSEADSHGVPASSDPLPNFAAHAKVDFNFKPEKECRKIAKRLKALAIARGCQYRPA
jgi:hypothetical protein